jgi:glutamine synthetase
MSTTLAEPWMETPAEMSRADILQHMRESDVRFLRLHFTDITGVNKNVEVPSSQFEKAFDGEILFDGSSIEGFSRIEESDMLLKPDLRTYRVEPFVSRGLNGRDHGRVARLICNVFNPDETPFEGCPRLTLLRQCTEAAKLGYQMNVGPEAEFFLFLRAPEGIATTQTHDAAGYFDLAPVDLGEECRREIVWALESMGFEIEAAHHEVAPGQHEIDFRYGDALTTADNLSTFRYIVRRVAREMNLHATFMPKPIFGQNGSGMHVHQSLFRAGKNAFYDDQEAYDGVSKVMTQYMAGLLDHARGMAAITNPLVNSYKRLVPGYEAPTHLAWSMRNRSPLIRVPARRGEGTRCELRMPDPACNPYLAFTVMLAAGLDGIRRELAPPPPISSNVYRMSARERARLKIRSLPANLGEAVDLLSKDGVLQDALGNHIFEHYVAAKRREWADYIAAVHPWEIEQYLTRY